MSIEDPRLSIDKRGSSIGAGDGNRTRVFGLGSGHSAIELRLQKKLRVSEAFGAGDVTRTHDLLITNQLHYRLCYTSKNSKSLNSQSNLLKYFTIGIAICQVKM